MSDTDEKIIHQLELDDSGSPQAALFQTYHDLLDNIKSEYGSEYEVKADNTDDLEDDWSKEIKIRKGGKIGAGINFEWKKSKPAQVEITVDESSKFGTILLMVCVLGFAIVCAIMAATHTPPLDFLPGRKLAAGLGGLIGLIPGGILYAIMKPLVMGSAKKDNKALVEKVWNSTSAFYK